MPLPVAIELAMVARFYERFGDHAVNLLGGWPPWSARASNRDLGPRLTRPPVQKRSWSRASAIWTAFRAAPLRRLSPTTKRASPCSNPSARRMRPT